MHPKLGSYDANKKAFNIGRIAEHSQHSLASILDEGIGKNQLKREDIATLISKRTAFLTDYQNSAYAKKYQVLVEKVIEREQQIDIESSILATAVARYAFKLMVYKDEYEVARLYTNGNFDEKIRETFEGNYKLYYHLAPPLLTGVNKQTGASKKLALGGWGYPAFKLLTKLKGCTVLVLIFFYTQERTTERALIER